MEKKGRGGESLGLVIGEKQNSSVKGKENARVEYSFPVIFANKSTYYSDKNFPLY
jgi:hypothetical protein